MGPRLGRFTWGQHTKVQHTMNPIIRPLPRRRTRYFTPIPPAAQWPVFVFSAAAILGLATAAILWATGAFEAPKRLSPRAQRSAFDNAAADGASVAWKRLAPEERETRRRAKRLVFPQASRADVDAEIEGDLRYEAKRRMNTQAIFSDLEKMGRNEWPDRKGKGK